MDNTLESKVRDAMVQFALPGPTHTKSEIVEQLYHSATGEKYDKNQRVQHKDKLEALQHAATKQTHKVIEGLDNAYLTEAENAQTANPSYRLDALGMGDNKQIRAALWRLAKRNPDGTIDSYISNIIFCYALETEQGWRTIMDMPEIRANTIRSIANRTKQVVPPMIVNKEIFNPRGQYTKEEYLAKYGALSRQIIAAIDDALLR